MQAFTHPLSAAGTLMLCVLMCLATSAPVFAAKVAPIAELTALPENEDEQRLWDIASGHEHNIGNEGRLYEDRAMEAYLESIAHRLMGDRLDRLGIRVDFIIVKNNLLSAWVYPYGTIAVNTGLLSSMENEAQLAAILAHELSHFMQRHSYRELIAERRQSVLGKGLGLLATAAVAAKTGVVDTNLMQAGGLWTDLVTSGYSRKLEHVADAEGLELMQAAGYDITQATRAFEILGQNAEYGLVNPKLLWSSHPKLEDRIDNISKAIRDAEKAKGYQRGGFNDAATYLAAVAPAVLLNGRMDLNEKMFARADRAFTLYQQAEPARADGFYWAAEAMRIKAPEGPDFEPRVRAYRSAIAAEPSYAAAYKELGLTYRQQKRNADARTALQGYLRNAPDAPDAGIIRWYLNNLR